MLFVKSYHLYRLRTWLAVVICLPLTGCYVSSHTQPIQPLIGPPVQNTVTPYHAMLQCVGQLAQAHNPPYVIAVDNIPDRTGKFSYTQDGYEVTQGAQDMAVSALGETEAYKLVERSQFSIPLFEMQMANNFLLRDANPNNNMDTQGKIARKIYSGTLLGSDYVLVGSITEINYNLASGGYEFTVDGIGPGWRAFWMDVGVDLRLVNTKTGEIVMTLPLRKQIWGYENKFNVVRFFGSTFVDAHAGEKDQEPIELAVRSVIEDGVIQMTKQLYQLSPNACEAYDPANGYVSSNHGGLPVPFVAFQ